MDSESGALLGLAHGEMLVPKGGLKARRESRAFADKESRRWLSGAEAAAALVAAVSVLQLVRDRDGAAKRPLADVFEPDEQPALEAVSAELEGNTEKQKNPHPKGSLAFAAWVYARLGGWTGYYGKPGPLVMLRGLRRFRAMQHGWNLA